MQLFCKAGAVVAWYPDGTTVSGEAHPGATVISYDGALDGLGRVGGDLAEGESDFRPYKTPAIDLASYARQVSWRKRVDGLPINGLHVATDPDSLTLISGMESLARVQPERLFNFDTAVGPIQMTAEQAIEFAIEVATIVQATFDLRAEVLAGIDAGTITTTEEIDAAFADL
jgi:hypothetical protein